MSVLLSFVQAQQHYCAPASPVLCCQPPGRVAAACRCCRLGPVSKLPAIAIAGTRINKLLTPWITRIVTNTLMVINTLMGINTLIGIKIPTQGLIFTSSMIAPFQALNQITLFVIVSQVTLLTTHTLVVDQGRVIIKTRGCNAGSAPTSQHKPSAGLTQLVRLAMWRL